MSGNNLFRLVTLMFMLENLGSRQMTNVANLWTKQHQLRLPMSSSNNSRPIKLDCDRGIEVLIHTTSGNPAYSM